MHLQTLKLLCRVLSIGMCSYRANRTWQPRIRRSQPQQDLRQSPLPGGTSLQVIATWHRMAQCRSHSRMAQSFPSITMRSTWAAFSAARISSISTLAPRRNIGLHEWGTRRSDGGNVGTKGNNDGFTTISGGIIFRYPTSDITPFVHALVGGARVDGPDHNPYKWGPDLTAGGGVDYQTPLFDHRLSIRVFQADYEYMHADFGPGVNGGRANIDAARLSGGLVFHIGTIAPPPPVTLACSASPTSVFPGDPVTVTATADMLNPKLHAVYTFREKA